MKKNNHIINDSEISFVVQGPITKDINYNLSTIRYNFPSSRIIISTWEKEDISFLNISNYDEIIQNQDPGNMPPPLHNVNRQITSTINGLKKVNTKYVIKIRTDCSLNSREFVDIYNKHNFKSKYNIFKDKILIISAYAKDPIKWSVLFHISDLFFFGTSKDIYNLFNIPLATNQKLAAEQYIICEYLKINNLIHVLNWYDLSIKKIYYSELYLSNSFILVDFDKQLFLNIDTTNQILFYKSLYKEPFYDLYNQKTFASLKFFIFRIIRIPKILYTSFKLYGKMQFTSNLKYIYFFFIFFKKLKSICKKII